VDRADHAVMRPRTAIYSDVLFVHEHHHPRSRIAGVLRKREGVTQTSRNPLLDMVRLQDSNPPPDDYKALEIINYYNNLWNFDVSKTADYIDVLTLSGKALYPIGNAEVTASWPPILLEHNVYRLRSNLGIGNGTSP
jgi:hypothetical protein